MTGQNLKLMGAISLALLVGPDPSRAQANETSFELRPGVVVEPASGKVYLMSPKNTVEAVTIETGRSEWSIAGALRPLAVSDNLLVCQAEPEAAGNTLNLVMLNTREQGKREKTAAVPLPPTVTPRIENGFAERFLIHATPNKSDTFISWEFQKMPVQGVRPNREERDKTVAAMKIQQEQDRGFIKLNVLSGEASSVPPADAPERLRALRPKNLSGPEGAPPDPTQRLSLDAKHTLKSSRVKDPAVWERYEWSIVDNATGSQVGRTKSHLSQSAFIVVGSRLLFETGPFSRRGNSGMVDEPLMIRAVDLTTGEEIWRQPVRDTEYRGEYPP